MVRRKQKLGHADFTRFNEQLASLLDSGMPLDDSLRRAARAVRRPGGEKVIREMAREVRKGVSFGKSLVAKGDVFPGSYRYIVQAGLESGKLPEILKTVVRNCNRIAAIKDMLRTVFLYPAMVLVVLSLVILLMLVDFMPALRGFFNVVVNAPDSLPLVTYWSTNAFLGGMFIFSLVMLAFCVVVIAGFPGRTKEGVTPLIVKIPFLGRIFSRWVSAVFLLEFSTMLRSGIPTVPALRLMSVAFEVPRVREQLARAAEKMSSGWDPGEVLREVAFLPPTIRLLLCSGASDKQIFEDAGEIAKVYEEDMKANHRFFKTSFEVTTLLLVGLAVASTYIAFWNMLTIAQMAGGLQW